MKRVQWRKFWSSFDLYTKKEQRLLKKFNQSRLLKKIESLFDITETDKSKLQKVFHKFLRKQNKIEFIYFVRFLQNNQDSINSLYKKNKKQAFGILLRALSKTKRKKDIYEKIFYRQKWIFFGQGRGYNLPNLQKKLRALRKKESIWFAPKKLGYNQSYFGFPKVEFNDELLFIIGKGQKKNAKLKFIAFSKKYNKVFFSPTFAFPEINSILFKLAHFGLVIEHKSTKNDFSKLMNFIKTVGTNEDLSLTGITFEESEIIKSFYDSSKRGKLQGYLSSQIKNQMQNLGASNLMNIYLISKVGDRFVKYSIQFENRLGIITAYLNTAKLHNDEKDCVIGICKKNLDLTFDSPYVNPNFDKKSLYQEILDRSSKKTYPGSTLSGDLLEIYEKLEGMKILEKPSIQSYAWKCTNPNCVKRWQIEWSKTGVSCRCGSKKRKVHEMIEFKKNENGIMKAVAQIAKRDGLIADVIPRKVLGKKIVVVKVVAKDKELLTIVPQYNRADTRYVEELTRRCTNVLVLRTSAKDPGSEEIAESISMSDFFFDYLENNKKGLIEEAFKNQTKKWDQKIISAANNSEKQLQTLNGSSAIGSYSPSNFEIDCFNLIHYIFRNANWLGANEPGKKLPDGIAAFPIGQTVGCLIWDCKLSKKNARVGSVPKNLEYILKLRKNKLVKALGGLHCYIIISNNPNQKNFQKTFNKVIKNRSARRVSLFLINSKELTELYSVVKEAQRGISNNTHPTNELFSKIYAFFTSKKPKFIEAQDVSTLKENIKAASKPINQLDHTKFS